MARLLPLCLLLVLLSALLMECEARKRALPRLRRKCCYLSGCLMKRGLRCCHGKRCRKIRGNRGVCRRRGGPNCKTGRDAEETEEDPAMPDTRDVEDNDPMDFLDTVFNP